jgi:hypothetical protein
VTRPRRRKLSPYNEALTRDEAIALEAQLKRPITWAPDHYHGSFAACEEQRSNPTGANQVPARNIDGGVA